MRKEEIPVVTFRAVTSGRQRCLLKEKMARQNDAGHVYNPGRNTCIITLTGRPTRAGSRTDWEVPDG